MKNGDKLRERLEQQARRMRQADKDRPTLLAQTAYLGVLGLVLVLPVVGGAYLGRWLDSLVPGYSLRWTISLIIAGLAVGAFNVYFLIKDKGGEHD